MFVCLNCGEIFEDPEMLIEKHGLDGPPYEHLSVSPCCKGEYVETYRCDCCGEWINTDTFVEIDSNRYCEDCYTVHDLENI